jgi:putative tryptophan/tyrosine transport system substrate-binding protein
MRLSTVGLVATLALVLLAAPLPTPAQPARTVYRIGYMSIPSRESAEHLIPVFMQALRARGLVEGENLLIEWRWAEGKLERLPVFAQDLVQRKVDLIIAPQTDSALAAKRATATIPIVFLFAEDPVADGLVASLARPGGNVTGLTYTPSLELVTKQLELLKEAISQVSRVAVLWNPARYYTTRKLILSHLQAAAPSLGVELHVVEARGPEDFEPAFASMVRWQAQALLVVTDSVFWIHRRRLAELEARHRLPGMHPERERVEAGSLMAYGPSLADIMQRAAPYIEKILRGAKPAELPVEQPTKFELVLNLKTAKALGLTLPPHLLYFADEVLQ